MAWPPTTHQDVQDAVTARAVIGDVGTSGTPTGDALRAAFDARYAPIGGGGGTRLLALPKFSAAVAAVQAGTRDAKILCLGDSTTAGVGTAAGNAVGNAATYPYRLAWLLNGQVPAARGLGVAPSALATNPDARWTAGAGWSLMSFGWGGAADYQGATGAAGSLVYADPVLADRFDIYYLTNGGLGTLTAQATGGTTVTQSTSASAGATKVTVSAAGASTSNTLTITNTSGANVHIIGVEPWLSTTKRVRVGNAGVGSSKASDWASNSGLGGAQSISAYAADLTIISLGINDANAGATASTFAANVLTLAQAAAVSGDVLILPPFPSTTDATGAALTLQAQYADSLRALGYPYLDMYSLLGRPGDNLPHMTGWDYDTYHYNSAGYFEVAEFIAAPGRIG